MYGRSWVRIPPVNSEIFFWVLLSPDITLCLIYLLWEYLRDCQMQLNIVSLPMVAFVRIVNLTNFTWVIPAYLQTVVTSPFQFYTSHQGVSFRVSIVTHPRPYLPNFIASQCHKIVTFSSARTVTKQFIYVIIRSYRAPWTLGPNCGAPVVPPAFINEREHTGKVSGRAYPRWTWGKRSIYYISFSELQGFLLLWKHDIFTSEDKFDIFTCEAFFFFKLMHVFIPTPPRVFWNTDLAYSAPYLRLAQLLILLQGDVA